MIPFITTLSILIPLAITCIMHDGFIRFILVTMTFEFIFIVTVYIIGLNKDEKKLIHNTVNTIKRKWN